MKALLLLPAFLMVACAQARPPRPVSVMVSEDIQLTCKQIALEYQDNTTAATQKIEKNRSSDIEELFAALLIGPVVIDLQNADGVEGNALLERNLRLRTLAIEKNCDGVERWPGQPARYS